MRLLFLSNLYPPLDIGGYERSCAETAVGLIERGHRVSVLTSNYRADELTGVEENITRSLFLETGIAYYQPIQFLAHWRKQQAHNLSELKRAIDQVNPDLIVIWGMWNLSHSLPHTAQLLYPKRVAYYLCSYWPLDLDPHHGYWNSKAESLSGRVFKGLLGPVASLMMKDYPPTFTLHNPVCTSYYVRDKLASGGAIESTAKVIMDGVNTTLFPSHQITDNEHVRLIAMGSLIYHKGFHTILEALYYLQQNWQLNRLSLTILGSGHPTYVQMLHRMVSDYHLESVVTFVSRLPYEKYASFVAEHDVFIFSSTWEEPFGRTIVEAMAGGLITIGTAVGGSKEIFEMYDQSLLFEPEDSIALAECIQRVVSDSTLRSELVALGKLIAQNFTRKRFVDEFETFLLEQSQGL